MNKTLLALVVVLWFFVSLLFSAFPNQVSADSTSSVSFVDSGVTVFSPVNMTYYYRDLILNLSLYGAGNLGSLDPNISMNYSIDGSYNGSVPLKSNGEIHLVTGAIGTVFLPDLPDGSHTLTLYLYGLNQRTYEPKYLTFTNTVYFSTEGNPILSSTPTPSLTPTATIAEFPASWVILLLLAVTTLATLVTFIRRLRNRNTINQNSKAVSMAILECRMPK